MPDAKKLAVLKQAKDVGATAPEWFQLFPAGEVWLDGEDKPVIMDAEGAALIIADFQARTNDMVIDYEHQTLDGVKAPAAGWIKEIQWRGDDPATGGLWLRVEWTATAAAHIEAREYRYFSPVFWFRNADRKIVELENVALTNQPKMMNITALAAKKLTQTQQEENHMDFVKKLAKALDLAETATEDDVIAKVTENLVVSKAALEALGIKPQGTETEITKAVQDKIKEIAKKEGADAGGTVAPVASKEILEALGMKEDDTAEAVVARIQNLRDKSGNADTIETQFAALKKDHESLEKKWNERDRDERVSKAIASGKITPAQKEWAEGYALNDPKGFDAFIAKQPQVVPLEELNKGKGPGGGDGTPAEQMDKLIAKKMKDNDKLTYGEAMNIVSKENPELAQAYVEACRG